MPRSNYCNFFLKNNQAAKQVQNGYYRKGCEITTGGGQETAVMVGQLVIFFFNNDNYGEFVLPNPSKSAQNSPEL